MGCLAVSMIKRLGIFVFYNKTGDAGAYVDYLLASIHPHLSEMILVSNCKLSYLTQKLFLKYTENIFVRENEGMDAAAYKKALLYYCGKEKCNGFDEVILFNDTIYGPFYSFDEIFASMNKRDIDFWGMLAGYQSVDSSGVMPCGYIPDHIQSWFWAFRKPLLNSEEFWTYWEQYDDSLNSFWEIVSKHEFMFTNYFENLGYKWDVFSDSLEYRFDDQNKNYNFYGYSAELMLRKMHTPFLKRKPFSMPRHELLYMNGGEDMYRALNYVNQNTEYPVKLIYGDLLTNYNIYDIFDSLHLNFIISSKMPAPEWDNDKEIGIFLLCHSEESCAEFTEHISLVSQYIDTYLITSEDLLESIETNLKNRGIGAMRIRMNVRNADSYLCLKDIPKLDQYKYVVFIHDAFCIRGDKPDTIYRSISFNYKENLIKSRESIHNMILEFESNPSLGLLEAPMPLHHNYFHFYEDSWSNYYEKIKSISEAIPLQCNLEETKQILSASGAFACRRVILDKLFSSPLMENLDSINEAGIFNRLIQFLAQDAGYCTGLIYSSEYASLELANFRYYLSGMMVNMRTAGMADSFFHGYMENLKNTGSEPSYTDTPCSLYEKIRQRDEEIARLYPLTSLKLQVKLRLKKYLPKILYKIALTIKRFLFGPRNLLFDYKQ